MKILVTTYSTAFLNIGGGESELVQVVDALALGGMQADVYGVSSRPIEYYDLVMHFSIQPEGMDLYRAVLAHKKVVLWPNVWWSEKPSDAEIKRVTDIANRAHKLLFKSYVEQDNFLRYVPVPVEQCIVVPIFVSDKFLVAPDTALAKTVTDFDEYVLCLGRVEPIKNQLILIQALKALGLNGVMVGGYGDKVYYERCRNENVGHIQFLPFIKPCSALLLSLIANSQLVAELSLDPAGRSSLEAAAMSKPLLLSDDAWVDEYFADTVYKADPENLDSVIEHLGQALKGTGNKAALSSQRAKDNALPSTIESMVKTLINACI